MNKSDIKNDIEYAIHVEHEVPMERYTDLQSLIESLVDIVVTHANAEARRQVTELKYKVVTHLKTQVGAVLDVADEPKEETDYRW